MSNPHHPIIEALTPFAPHFCRQRTWEKARMLVIGSLLTNGRRVVTAALRMVGLADKPSFNQYHQVLSRAVWSPLVLARTLLGLLLHTFCVPDEPLIFGIDETIERRWGRKIAARGIYRDAVRSSASHFVKASGLRWISVMLLIPVPWAARVFALPALTAVAPSERYYQHRKRAPKTLLDRALQLLKVLKRWLPERDIVVVGDGSYAAIDFLHECQQLGITFTTRLRLRHSMIPRQRTAVEDARARRGHARRTCQTGLRMSKPCGKRYNSTGMVDSSDPCTLPPAPLSGSTMANQRSQFAGC